MLTHRIVTQTPYLYIRLAEIYTYCFSDIVCVLLLSGDETATGDNEVTHLQLAVKYMERLEFSWSCWTQALDATYV
jgi:hypothetical protein